VINGFGLWVASGVIMMEEAGAVEINIKRITNRTIAYEIGFGEGVYCEDI
jgi:hypothetical protein